jgi:hypothetical protein
MPHSYRIFSLPILSLLLTGLAQPASAAWQQINRKSAFCGSSNGATLASAPTENLCSVGSASAVSGSGPWSWSCTTRRSVATCFANPVPQPSSSVSTPVPVNGANPASIYGVTLDDVSNVNGELNALQQIAHKPTARIVFDTGEPPTYYLGPIQTFSASAYIMGELVDSSYMTAYTASSVATWTQSYLQTLGGLVNIWEVGNEVNGNWLSNESNGADVLPKIEAMYDAVAAQSGVTAITFFYEGEPTDPNNCIATDHGGNDMFTWITNNFQLNLPAAQRPAATEQIRLNLNYALISWYPDQCPGESPNWAWVYTQLASIFPNAKVGFGELGIANPQNGSAYEFSEIAQYYPMAKTVAGLPASYIGGYFWWYFAEEMVPWPGSLGLTLNQAIQ